LGGGAHKITRIEAISLFARWFQPGLISWPTVFFSHNKPASAEFISPETNQRTGRVKADMMPAFSISTCTQPGSPAWRLEARCGWRGAVVVLDVDDQRRLQTSWKYDPVESTYNTKHMLYRGKDLTDVHGNNEGTSQHTRPASIAYWSQQLRITISHSL